MSHGSAVLEHIYEYHHLRRLPALTRRPRSADQDRRKVLLRTWLQADPHPSFASRAWRRERLLRPGVLVQLTRTDHVILLDASGGGFRVAAGPSLAHPQLVLRVVVTTGLELAFACSLIWSSQRIHGLYIEGLASPGGAPVPSPYPERGRRMAGLQARSASNTRSRSDQP